MKWIIRVGKMVVAPAVAAVSLVAACGSDEEGKVTAQVESQAEVSPPIAERERQLQSARIAEALERQAKYEGHVKTYLDDVSEEQAEFLPGSRHMPTR
jgi:hypothetical protein